MIRSGRLDRTISIERDYTEVTATGATIVESRDVLTIRAELVDNALDGVVRPSGPGEDADAVFCVRYVIGLQTAYRVRYGCDRYEIVRIVEIGRRRGLKLHCKRLPS